MSEEVKVELSLKDKASPALLKFQRTAVSAAKRIKSAFGGMIKAAFSLKGALLAVGGAAVARSFIEAGNKMEKFRQQLTGLANGVKSVAEANLTWLRKFGATTTHTTADVIQSFVQLKAVGIDANKEMMTAVGDAAYMFDKNITDVAQGLIGLETDVMRKLGVDIDRTGKKAIISSGNIRMEMEKDFASIQKGVIEIWGKRWPGAMKNAENTWEGMMSLILSRWQDFQADVMEAGVFEHLKEGAKVATKMVDEMGITAEDTAQVIKESMKIAIYAIAGVADGAKAAGIAIAWLGKQASWSAGLIAKAMDAASGLGTKLGKALASSDKSTGGQLKSGLNLIEKIFGVNFKSSAEKVKAVVSKTNEDIAENTKLLDEQMAAIWEKGSSWEAVTGFYDRLDARAKKSADVAKKEAEKTSGIYEGVLPEIGGSSDQKSARTAFSMQFEPTAGESKAATEAENYRTAILYLADAAEKALGPIKKIRTIFGDISETAYNLIRTIGGTFPGVMGMMVSSAVLLTRNTKKAKQEVISLGRAFAGVANIITNHVLNAFEELIRSGKLGTQQLRQMLVELGIDIARMMAQMAAQAAIKTAVTYMAEGGVAVGGMSNPQPIPSYAGGTIVRGPHVAVVGDNPEAEEAIIPMKGGKVPVDLKGSGGGGNININITAMDGADVERVLMNNSDKLAAALQKVSAESGAARG